MKDGDWIPGRRMIDLVGINEDEVASAHDRIFNQILETMDDVTTIAQSSNSKRLSYCPECRSILASGECPNCGCGCR